MLKEKWWRPEEACQSEAVAATAAAGPKMLITETVEACLVEDGRRRVTGAANGLGVENLSECN